MIPEEYLGQVIVDIAAFIILALILIVHYAITVPYEKTILRKAKNK